MHYKTYMIGNNPEIINLEINSVPTNLLIAIQ